MPMVSDDITKMIMAALPGATVEITDLRGDGDHYHVLVTYAGFAGQTRIQQHQMVYGALQGKMGGELHAMSLTTKTA